MSTNRRIYIGLAITAIVFLLSILVARWYDTGIDFIPNSFVTHTTMLILSILVIILLGPQVNYVIKWPSLRKTLMPILLGIVVSIAVNIILTVITNAIGGKVEAHPVLAKISPLQTFLFVFIYASIAEEMLFRGFLQNILKPLASKGISISGRKISLPVIISAVLFGLSHLILLTAGSGAIFVARIVIFTMTLGVVAGYYQEKYNNNAFAIIVHMSGNLMGVVGSLLMSLNPQ